MISRVFWKYLTFSSYRANSYHDVRNFSTESFLGPITFKAHLDGKKHKNKVALGSTIIAKFEHAPPAEIKPFSGQIANNGKEKWEILHFNPERFVLDGKLIKTENITPNEFMKLTKKGFYKLKDFSGFGDEVKQIVRQFHCVPCQTYEFHISGANIGK